MARNKKYIRKTPKKGGKESRVGPKRLFKGSNKSKKFISKQKCRLGFNELSPNQLSTPKSVKIPPPVAPQDVGPSSSTAPMAPSSFGSAENSPMTRRAGKAYPNIMEKFKNNHMVPNMGLKRRKTATKHDSVTVSMKVNFSKSKISDKKKIMDNCKTGENLSDRVKSRDIQETNNVINVSCSSVNEEESSNKKDEESTILLDQSRDIQETSNVSNVSCSSVNEKESGNKKDEESTILLDDSMDEYNNDNADSSHIHVIKDPELEPVCAQGSTKKLFPLTPPAPQPVASPAAPASPQPVASPAAPASPQPVASPAAPASPQPVASPAAPASPQPVASPAAPTSPQPVASPAAPSSPQPVASPAAPTSPQPVASPAAPTSPALGSSIGTPDKKNDPVEDLGEEMLNFVTDKAFNNPVPDTPKTLLKRDDPFKDILKISSNESEKKSDETEDDVIVIDDDFEVIDEDDDLAIVGEVSGNRDVKSNLKPLTTSNLQAITERYQPPSQDFIGFEIDKTPRKPSLVQMTQQGGRQLNQKWKEMRKKVNRRKNVGGSNVNTLPLPKSCRPRNNLLVGPSLLTDSQRQGPSNPPNKKTPKPLKAGGQRGSQDKRAGDWTCSCGNYNFQWRNKCGKCNNKGGAKSLESPPLIQNEGPTSIVPQTQQTTKSGLRPIVIDGSNVAMAHGLNTNFSAEGIQICIQFFKKRGHAEIKAFMPQIRQGAHPELLEKLYKDGHIVFTPSRKLHDGTNVISYDDSMFIEYAHELGGVIVSRDNFKDVMKSKPEWRETIETRLLMPTFAGDYLMFPPDPLGRGGPSLDQFLTF